MAYSHALVNLSFIIGEVVGTRHPGIDAAPERCGNASFEGGCFTGEPLGENATFFTCK